MASGETEHGQFSSVVRIIIPMTVYTNWVTRTYRDKSAFEMR